MSNETIRFADLGLSEATLRAVEAMGFAEPTPIQKETIPLVMDGRDIGTVVFPEAELKIYMTADPMVRAERRYKELTAKGDNVTLEEVYENVISRDKADMTRAISPLRKADDAIVLDNSTMTVEEQMAWFDREFKRVTSL